MLKVFRDKETGKIKSLRTGRVIFSYAHLTSPRPEDDPFDAGKYTTDLIILDDETLAAVKEYIKEAIDTGKEEIFKGSLGKDFRVPLRAGSDESEIEADRFVLKTKSQFQPELYIKDPDTKQMNEVDADTIDEIYSGMIGEAIIVIKPYNYKNANKGVSAYVSAVLKTEEGTMLGGNVSYAKMFSDEIGFDDEPEDEEDPLANIKPKGSKGKASKKVVVEEEPEEEINLDDLINASPKDETAAPAKKQSKELSLDDLLK